MKHSRRLKRTAFGGILLTSTVLLFMMVGTSLALTDPVFIHGQDPNGGPDPQTQIILRGENGQAITVGTGLKNAFSVKETCGACHDGTTLRPSNGERLPSYTEIESHSYHAQMGANNLAGWNKNDTAKRWVQSSGHFGKW